MWRMQPAVWVADFGADVVTVAAAERRSGEKRPRILGIGQARSQGWRAGEFSNVGDAAESLVSALRRAEDVCGLKCGEIFFNFDDLQMESCFPVGTRTLAGEGQIRREDVAEAVMDARRPVTHFAKDIVYCREINFFIDGRDSVANPVGVFGRQLDVMLHVLLARTRTMENWRQVVDRARLKKGVPVLSILSCAYGVLAPDQWSESVMVCDLGEDVLNAAVFKNGVIHRFACVSTPSDKQKMTRWVVQTAEEFIGHHANIQQLVLTGDLAQNQTVFSSVQHHLTSKLRVVVIPAASGSQPLESTALNGLLAVGAEQRDGSRLNHMPQDLISDLRQKAVTLAQEYF